MVSSVNLKKNSQTPCLTVSVYCCTVGQGGVPRPLVVGKLRSAGRDAVELIHCQRGCGHLAFQLYQTVKVALSRGWQLRLAGDCCSAGAADQTASTREQLSSQAEVSEPSIPRGSGRTRESPSSHQMHCRFLFTKTATHVWQEEVN